MWQYERKKANDSLGTYYRNTNPIMQNDANKKIAIMYASDYGYAVLASDCARTNRLSNYDSTAACHDNNWLFQGSSQHQRLISPSASNADNTFSVNYYGYVYTDDSVANALAYSPVMALKADVTVTGSGTQSDPYVMN